MNNNSHKSKGRLKKLKWYCQVCQHQSSDENGFKNHLASEGHIHKMALFSTNPEARVAEYSQAFENEMLKLIRSMFSGKRTPINIIYGEYIKDPHRVHMNATRWVSLNGFFRSLQKRGIVELEPFAESFFVTYTPKREVSALEKQREEEQRLEEEEKRLQAERDKALEKARAEVGREVAVRDIVNKDNTSTDEKDSKKRTQKTSTSAAVRGSIVFKRRGPTRALPVKKAPIMSVSSNLLDGNKPQEISE